MEVIMEKKTAAAAATNEPQNHPHQYLIMSSAMRAYIESLPEKLTIMDELKQYQFWKSLRTEFIATFFYVIFTCGSLVLSHYPNPWQHSMEDCGTADDPILCQSNNSDHNNTSEQIQLKNAIGTGLTVATLVQCTGHVCGCHLTIAITIGLYVSGRVSPLRIVSYLFIQCLASMVGVIVVQNLFGHLIVIAPEETLKPTQVFGFEFLSTLIIVLTYLANCDQNRRDLGFKSLSIGLAYTVAHLFAFQATGASLNPAKTLAISMLAGNYCLHWIYWIAPLIAGLFGGLLYEYIGSIKPPPLNINCGCCTNCCCSCAKMFRESATSSSSELRHQFNRPMAKKQPYPTNPATIMTVNGGEEGILANNVSKLVQIGLTTATTTTRASHLPPSTTVESSALLDDETDLFSIGPDPNSSGNCIHLEQNNLARY